MENIFLNGWWQSNSNTIFDNMNYIDNIVIERVYKEAGVIW